MNRGGRDEIGSRAMNCCWVVGQCVNEGVLGSYFTRDELQRLRPACIFDAYKHEKMPIGSVCHS